MTPGEDRVAAVDRVILTWLTLALVCAALSGCVHVAPVAMPSGRVTASDVIAYQDARIAADAEAERRKILRRRVATWLCTCADIATTLYAVNHDDRLVEGNPLLPNPSARPLVFVGVKLSIGGFFDRAARRGEATAVWVYSGTACGAAAWNVYQTMR